MAYLTGVHSVLLHARYRGSQILDSYLEDPISGLRFYALNLNGIVSIHLGVCDGELWYRWIWMWESTQEADAALNKLPPGFDEAWDAVIDSIRSFLHNSQAAGDHNTRLCTFDLTPQLASLGLDMAAVEITKEQATHELARYQRLAASSGKTP
jgi:hypothetical protein